MRTLLKIIINCVILNLWVIIFSGLLAYIFFKFNKPWVYTTVGFVSLFAIFFIGFNTFLGKKDNSFVKLNWVVLIIGIGSAIYPMFQSVTYFVGETKTITNIEEVAASDNSIKFFKFQENPDLDTTGYAIKEQLEYQYFFKTNGSNSHNHFYYIIVPFKNQTNPTVWFSREFTSKTQVPVESRHYFLEEFLEEWEKIWPKYTWFQRKENPSKNEIERVEMYTDESIFLTPINSLNEKQNDSLYYLKIALLVTNCLYVVFMVSPFFSKTKTKK